MTLDLTNTEVAFRFLSNTRLKKAYLLFRMMQNPKLVKVGTSMVESALKMHLPIKFVVKKTLFEQFCGGETLKECIPLSNQLKKASVRVILDYSVEAQDSDTSFDKHTAHVLQSIDFAKSHNNTAFAVFKPTAIAGSSGVDQKARARFQKIFDRARERDVPVLVDAEESWLQTAFDDVLLEMMPTYNRGRAIIYNTLQMYRTDRLDYLEKVLLTKARADNFKVGIKLVRGAYMEKERERASELGYPSPIHPSKSATDRAYNSALELILRNLEQLPVLLGTHNLESVKLACDKMQAMKVAKNDVKVFFSQLYGMSDHLTFNLAQNGFNVAKLIPYGPLESVLPYLFRRAEENTAIDGQLGRELELLTKEINRRYL